MKLLLIGQSVEDHIYYKNNFEVKPGGIFYSTAALHSIKEPEDEIYLCTSYKKNDHLFRDIYDEVNPAYLNFSDVIPKVRLNIYDDREREEIYENITGRLIIDTDNLEFFDGILINMITGYDITIEQLREIRKNYSGLIYFDVHTFSRGLDKDMKREFRLIPEFDRWLQYIDILQVNTRELFTVSGLQDKDEIIRYVLNTNVKYLLETKGDEGSVCYRHE